MNSGSIISTSLLPISLAARAGHGVEAAVRVDTDLKITT